MPDQVNSVSCNHCGATLHVPDDTRFVTCSYCGTQLEVHRSDGAIYTQVLQALDQRTQQMAQDLTAIRRQNEVEQLDREWQMKRQTLLVRGKYGDTSVPSAAGALIGSAVAVVVGCLWMAVTGTAGAPAPFVLFGLLFIAVAIIGALTSVGKAANYREAEQDYLRQRDALLRSDRQRPA